MHHRTVACLAHSEARSEHVAGLQEFGDRDAPAGAAFITALAFGTAIPTKTPGNTRGKNLAIVM